MWLRFMRVVVQAHLESTWLGKAGNSSPPSPTWRFPDGWDIKKLVKPSLTMVCLKMWIQRSRLAKICSFWVVCLFLANKQCEAILQVAAYHFSSQDVISLRRPLTLHPQRNQELTFRSKYLPALPFQTASGFSLSTSVTWPNFPCWPSALTAGIFKQEQASGSNRKQIQPSHLHNSLGVRTIYHQMFLKASGRDCILGFSARN